MHWSPHPFSNTYTDTDSVTAQHPHLALIIESECSAKIQFAHLKYETCHPAKQTSCSSLLIICCLPVPYVEPPGKQSQQATAAHGIYHRLTVQNSPSGISGALISVMEWSGGRHTAAAGVEQSLSASKWPLRALWPVQPLCLTLHTGP